MKYSICFITILSCCAFHLTEGHEQGEPGFPSKPGTKCDIAAKAVMHEIEEHMLADAQPPSCDADGNYNKVQCIYWPENYCWCVLPISGITIPGTEKKAYENEMKCDMEPPHHPDFPPKKRAHCGTALSIILYEMELGLVDYPLPDCDNDGDYNSVRCSSKKSNRCWCVDPNTGNTIKGTQEKNVEESKMKCGGTKEDYKFPPIPGTLCDFAEKSYMIQIKHHSLQDAQPPSCDAEGNYNKVQCLSWPQPFCWCVVPRLGIQVPNSEKEGAFEKDMKCDEDLPAHPEFPPKKGTYCFKALETVLYEREREKIDYDDIPSPPKCDHNGNYHKVQCGDYPDYACWCVTRKSGKEIKGTRKKDAFYDYEMKCKGKKGKKDKDKKKGKKDKKGKKNNKADAGF